MSKVDWSKAPADAEFYGCEAFRKVSSSSFPDYWDGDLKHWDGGSFSLDEILSATDYEKRPEQQAVDQVSKIDETVNERGNNYGKFKDGADIMQELKEVMRSTPNWRKLTPSQREALEMIQHKIGRILNGNPSYTDSWHDIQGYAKLVEDELNGEIK